MPVRMFLGFVVFWGVGINATVLYHWTQFIGRGRVSFRLITNDRSCPNLTIHGHSRSMQVRAQPSSRFPVLVCELNIPALPKSSVAWHGLQFPKPTKEGGIVFIGDTGCKKKLFLKEQKCVTATWPLRKILQTAESYLPSLIVHVGDYVYRERLERDNWRVWKKDWMDPARMEMARIPFLFLRGNHENCGRNFRGWLRFFDTEPYTGRCHERTTPFVVYQKSVALVVLDSSSDRYSFRPSHKFIMPQEIRRTASMRVFLLTHKPAFGYAKGKFYHNAGSLSAWRGYPFNAVISGHIHLFEILRTPYGFQFIVGTGGTKPDSLGKKPKGKDGIGGTLLRAEQKFGFLLWKNEQFSYHVVPTKNPPGNSKKMEK